MYCAKCGSLVNNNLNFCNSCGAKLKDDDSAGKPINPLSYLITALCIIGGGGLILLVGLITILLDKNVEPKVLAAITVFYLLALTSVNFMIIRQISRLIGAQIESAKGGHDRQPVELYSHNTAQLEAPRQSAVSVTDHTTRALEEVLIKER